MIADTSTGEIVKKVQTIEVCRMGLVDTMRTIIAEIERSRPGLVVQKMDNGSSVRLRVPKVIESGFDVVVEVSEDQLHIGTDCGWHTDESGVAPDRLRNWMGLVRDLLSENMRIRQLSAGGSAYSWELQGFDGSKWVSEGSTNLMFFPSFLGKRTEAILQNRTLPPRPL
jgi:hypothetical protein